MTTTAPIQAELTLSKARAAYERAMEAMRDRHNPPAYSDALPQTWEVAAAHVVMGLMEWERVAILRYLIAQKGLAIPDVALAKCIAARLNLTITFAEPMPVTKKAWG